MMGMSMLIACSRSLYPCKSGESIFAMTRSKCDCPLESMDKAVDASSTQETEKINVGKLISQKENTERTKRYTLLLKKLFGCISCK